MGKKIKSTVNVLKSPGSVLMNFIVLFYSVTCLFPVIWIFYSSFKTQNEFATNVLSPPSVLNLKNYHYVLVEMNIWRPMVNTLVITAIVVAMVLLFAFFNGYFIERFRFPGRRFISILYTGNLFIPVHAILVPTFIMFSVLSLYNKWYSTILPCICIELTLTFFLVRAYVSTIPRELEEAASIDGSSFSRTLFSIVLPVAKPVLVTCGIITFFHIWNEFPYSLILFSKEDYYTLPLALTRFKGDHVTDYPRFMTAMFISIVPALSIYVFFSKQIINGMMAGAVKG